MLFFLPQINVTSFANQSFSSFTIWISWLTSLSRLSLTLSVTNFQHSIPVSQRQNSSFYIYLYIFFAIIHQFAALSSDESRFPFMLQPEQPAKVCWRVQRVCLPWWEPRLQTVPPWHRNCTSVCAFRTFSQWVSTAGFTGRKVAIRRERSRAEPSWGCLLRFTSGHRGSLPPDSSSTPALFLLFPPFFFLPPSLPPSLLFSLRRLSNFSHDSLWFMPLLSRWFSLSQKASDSLSESMDNVVKCSCLSERSRMLPKLQFIWINH